MRRAIFSLIGALVVLAPLAGGDAAGKLRVVATIPDLAALAQAVGGDLVEVDTLARGTQNAHEIELRPTLFLKLRKADVLIENGLDLDSWADVAIQNSNNSKIVRGGPGLVDASRGIQVQEVPTVRVDRSMGDVHPGGNPHYSLDPGSAPIITQNIVNGFSRIDPEHRGTFERNRQEFLLRLDGAMPGWVKTMEPFRDAKVVVYHPQWIYFLRRFGLVEAGWIEEQPGIPPTPAHLTRLIRRMKDERIKIIIVSSWNDQKLAARVAQEAGARVVALAQMVGAVKGVDTYVGTIDYNIKALAQALR